MAQLNITLNQEEILQLLSENREDAFRTLLEDSLNSILQAESSAQLGAEKYERTVERTDSRNGSRERQLKTRLGSITLLVPRHRNVPFKTLLFDNYSRSEAALVSSMAEMVVNGVSTRRITKVMETLCGTSYSKSAVSEACKELDAHVDAFKNRSLDKEYPFLEVDATYFKVRENHRVISKAFMVAMATSEEGFREIIGFDIYDNESKETWKNFFISLKNRGLTGVKMITSDAHDGILYAIQHVFPDVPWQRCQAHFTRNIIDKVPSAYTQAVTEKLRDMFNSSDIQAARKVRDEIIEEYEEVAESAMACLDNGFESSMTIMVLPLSYRKIHRTTNYVERLNRELKRRSVALGVFPNQKSLSRIMGSLIIELNDIETAKKVPAKYRKIDMTVFKTCFGKLKRIAVEQRKEMVA